MTSGPERTMLVPILWAVAAAALGCDGGGDSVKTAPAPPPNLVITAVVKDWVWSFQYPDGRRSGELHVPSYGQVTVRTGPSGAGHTLRGANNLIHALPTMANDSDLQQVRKPGTYRMQCIEFCGLRHSTCGAIYVVHAPGGYEQWLATLPPPSTRPAP